MFLKLSHTGLKVYEISSALVLECYNITNMFPAHEKFNLVQQIRRAALSVHLNIAEGCSRKSQTERNRFTEVARGSLIEVDAALEIATQLSYCNETDLKIAGEHIITTFKLLSGMLKSTTS